MQKLKELGLVITFLFFWIFSAYISVNSAWGTPIINIGMEMGSTAEFSNSGGTFSINSSSPISGLYSFKSTAVGAALGWAQIRCLTADGIGVDCNAATSYSRFDFKAPSIPSAAEEFWYVANSATARKISLALDQNGKIRVYAGAGPSLIATGATTLSANTKYTIGLLSTSSAGASAYQVDINNVTDANLSGTTAQGSTGMATIYIGKAANLNSATVDYEIDNIMVDNAAMPANGVILPMIPSAAGSTQDCTAGTTGTFADVDEIPTDSDTTYVQKSASASQTCLFNLPTASSSGITGVVNAVKAYGACKEATNVNSSPSIRIRSNSANSDTTTYTSLTTSYVAFSKLISVDPGTSGVISLPDLDQMELGLVDIAATDQVRCSTFRLFVDVNNDVTPTPTPTNTPAGTATFTPTFTPTNTPTVTPTFTPTPTPTPTPTLTPDPLGSKFLLLLNAGG